MGHPTQPPIHSSHPDCACPECNQHRQVSFHTGFHETIPADRSVVIDYTNWKGRRTERVIKPLNLIWGANQWHPEPQWMIEAECEEDGTATIKTFPLTKIHSWSPYKS